MYGNVKKSYLKYFLGLLLFGSNGIVASFIHLNSYEIVLLRAVLGSVLLFILFLATGHRFTFFSHKRDYLFVALSGVSMAADWLLLFEAYAEIGVSLAMLINYTGPAVVIALSPLILKERITLPKVIALAATLSGAFLISGQAMADGMSVWGLICAAASAVAYAGIVLCDKLAKEMDGTENSMVQLLSATIVIIIFVGCKRGFAMQISVSEWFPILQLGLLNTGIACWFYFSAIGNLPAQSVAVCGYLEPLFAVLLSVMILQETISPQQIIGAILIIGGAIYGECRGQKRHPKELVPSKDKS